MVSPGSYLSFLSIDKWTMIFNLINTLILYKIIKKFFFQPVNKMINERKADIEKDYNNANDALNKADDLKRSYEIKISQSDEEARTIINNAKDRADFRYQEIVSEAKNQADSIMKRADEEIKLASQKAINNIKNEVAEMVVLTASKVINKELDQQGHEQLIESFLEEVKTYE